jgi:hypothetical protein
MATKIDLDVFGALMLDMICLYVHDAEFFAKDCSGRRGGTKLMEKLLDPASLGDDISHNTVLSFRLKQNTACWYLEDQEK